MYKLLFWGALCLYAGGSTVELYGGHVSKAVVGWGVITLICSAGIADALSDWLDE